MTSYYFTAIAAAILFISCVHLTLPAQSADEPYILQFFHVVIPFIAAYRISIKRHSFEINAKARKYFLIAFVMLGLFDLLYFVLLYGFRLNPKIQWVFAFTTVPYHFFYWIVSIALYSFYNEKPLKDFRIWLFFAGALGISVPFVLYPSYQLYLSNGSVSFLIMAISGVISSAILASLALYSFISAPSIHFAFLSLGLFSFAVTDWAIQVEELNRTFAVMSFNAFLWTLSGVMTCLPFFFRGSLLLTLRPFSPKSLINKMRLRLVLALVIPLMFLGLTLNSSWYGIVSLTFGMVFGCVTIAFAVQNLFDSVMEVAKQLGEVTQLKMTEADVEKSVSSAPEEFKDALFGVVLYNMEQQKRESEFNHRMAEKFNQVATQVAHDIRSPLSALKVSVEFTEELPESKRLMIKSAVSRIEDIANNLLIENATTPIGDLKSDESSVFLLSSLIEPLITEKRLEYRSLLNVVISSRIDPSAYGLFSKVKQSDFKRILSNLINNSVEAFEDRGNVVVELYSKGAMNVVAVRDNGKGIPSEVVTKLGTKGMTSGKENGKGLGLYYAVNMIKSWGGSFEVQSEVGKGTVVSLSLPKEDAPAWFVPELVISSNSKIVIVDDDISMHQIWKGRLESLNSEIEVFNFSNCKTFRSWQPSLADESVTYLVDFEFKGEKDTGLDVIRDLGIANNSILVTSRFEEDRLRQQCKELDLRLIPKPLASIVPIKFVEREKVAVDLVLIDDDLLIHETWRLSAKMREKSVKCFDSISAFLREAGDFSSDVPIYVDSALGEDQPGEILSEKIYHKGFHNIYLCTGFNRDDLKLGYWIKGCVGKMPPWM